VTGATLADDRLTSATPEDLRVALRTATPERIFQIKHALIAGLSIDEIATASGIDPWFLYQLRELVDAERAFGALGKVTAPELKRMKRLGFSDRQLAALRETTETAMREQRWKFGIHPAYKTVDTCAGEFPVVDAVSVFVLRRRERVRAVRRAGHRDPRQRAESDRPGRRVRLLLRAGRLAFRELGFKTIMINSNPETVSTDFDISDKLYFEPLTFEDVIEIVRWERPKASSCSSAARRRCSSPSRSKRPESRSSAPRPTRSTSQRTASDSRRWRVGWVSRSRLTGSRAQSKKRSAWRNGSAIRCWCAPPTCWVAAP